MEIAPETPSAERQTRPEDAGKPAILKISKRFEQRYHLATAIDRTLWLSRDRFEPTYAGRPWALWTANSQLRSEAGSEPVRWIVAQP